MSRSKPSPLRLIRSAVIAVVIFLVVINVWSYVSKELTKRRNVAERTEVTAAFRQQLAQYEGLPLQYFRIGNKDRYFVLMVRDAEKHPRYYSSAKDGHGNWVFQEIVMDGSDLK